MPGPVPNREDDLARPRSRKGSDQMPTTKGVAREATPYDADENWHPIAEQMWFSLIDSGQSDYYQQSDWAFAYSLCDDLSHYKSATWGDGSPKRSPEMLKAILAGLTNLLVSEGDRRRVRLELESPEPEQEPASVVAIADYRRALEVAQ